MPIELLEDQDISDTSPVIQRIQHWYKKITDLSIVPTQNWNVIRSIQIALLYEAGSAVSETSKATEVELEERIEAKFKELLTQFPTAFFENPSDHSLLCAVYKRTKKLDGKGMWRKFKDVKGTMRKMVADIGSDLNNLPSGKNLYSVLAHYILQSYKASV
jgi:hypothetical protein